jgi:hypothetical protein
MPYRQDHVDSGCCTSATHPAFHPSCPCNSTPRPQEPGRQDIAGRFLRVKQPQSRGHPGPLCERPPRRRAADHRAPGRHPPPPPPDQPGPGRVGWPDRLERAERERERLREHLRPGAVPPAVAVGRARAGEGPGGHEPAAHLPHRPVRVSGGAWGERTKGRDGKHDAAYGDRWRSIASSHP